MNGFDRPSLAMKVARAILARRPNRFRDIQALRAAVEGRVPPLDAPLSAWLTRHCRVEYSQDADGSVVTLTPRSNATEWRLLYLHGGAYVFPLVAPHWDIVRALILQTGASVTVPLYGLAPERNHIPAWRLVDAAFERMAEGDNKVAIVGDSAGANLALSLALRARDEHRRRPDRIVLFSPWLDLGLQDPAIRALEPHDVMLGVDGLRECGRWWTGGRDIRDPVLSPLYANLRGLPPIALFQGTADLLVVDARSFSDRAKTQGAAVRYFEYEGGFHVFMAATFTPEARDVFTRVAEFLEES